MSVDRLLTTVLGLYQDLHDEAQTEQIYATTTTLLTRLSNPLNVSLLTSQLLHAPAVWRRPEPPLRACFRLISIFNTAALHVQRNERETAQHRRGPGIGGGVGGVGGGGMSSDAWVRAVIQGADDRSPRWRHALVFAGLLLGTKGRDGAPSLSGGLRNTLEKAVVAAANLALAESHQEPHGHGSAAVVLALNYAFPLLSDAHRASIHFDLLLPSATGALLGPDGLDNGLFLTTIDRDLARLGRQLRWPESSPSFGHLRSLEQQPLVAGMGPLSRLIAHAVERTRDAQLVVRCQESLVAFTNELLRHWQSTRLCEVEPATEAAALSADTLQTTWPALWQLLKRILYATVAVLRAVAARSLFDARLSRDAVAPALATNALRVFRNVYFVSSVHGNSAFQAYTFTYLASIDVLTRYPAACAGLLSEMRPPRLAGAVPAHPLLRTLDLFYLNLAEHLPLSLTADQCDDLIVQPALTYLGVSPPSPSPPPALSPALSPPLSPRMTELYESAHSALLSALACPENAPLTARLAPFYADTLLASFPSLISPRQFRIAFKTLIQVLSPPFPLSASQPELAETLLEMVRFRVGTASAAPLLPRRGEGEGSQDAVASEQSALVLTLIDSLPFLPLGILDEWMDLAAAAVGQVADPTIRESVQRRFWELLVSGEMDVERAAIGVAWWGTRGGRELVLFGSRAAAAAAAAAAGRGGADRPYLMSGALVHEGMSKL